MKIPFLDLKRLYAPIREELDAVWRRVVASGRFITGVELEAFEEEFAFYCGSRHAIGVGNGLDALKLILRAMKVGPGDEVLVPGHTFIATAFAVSEVGATPILVDVDENTGNIDPNCLEAALTMQTRAVMPVHLYGRPADMEPIRRFAACRGLWVIEDAAQAHGAKYHGATAGSMSDAAGFSFYPAKNLGALGDGGSVVTNDTDLADRIRILRNYGSSRKYHHQLIGVNSRLDELQAGFLRVMLRHLDDWNKKRRAVARRYSTFLKTVADVWIPEEYDYEDSVWHLYVIRHPRRDQLLEVLADRGIQCQIHYPVPIHKTDAYRNNGLSNIELPRSENWARTCLSLPAAPYLTMDEQDYVLSSLKEASQHLSK